MVAGQSLRDPADAVVGKSDGNLTITLTAAGTGFDMAGRQVWGQSYNGRFVAPTIHADPGSNVAITLVNHLSTATSLHFHGLHVAPDGSADNPFLCVPPGTAFTYRLAIPAGHPQGTYWYHSHAMGTTCPAGGREPSGWAGSSGPSGAPPLGGTSAAAGMSDMPGMGTSGSASPPFEPGDVENQIIAGLSGVLIIGDDRALLPGDLRDVDTHTLVFKDAQIDAAGHIVQSTATAKIDSNAPTVRLVNGQLRPVLNMRPGQTQLWRLANVGADIFYQLQLDGYPFTVVGEDGVPVAAVSAARTLLLPPGKRYDVLVTAGHVGTTTLRTTAYSNGPQGDVYPDTVLAAVAINGAAAPPLTAVAGGLPTAPADLASAPVAQRRTVDLTESADGLRFFINGQRFTMGAGSVFPTPARLGTVEEWTIVNPSGEDHPFHLHTSHFQMMSVNGVSQTYTHVQDTVPVPHAVNGVSGNVVIRIAFTDYPGTWMFHCHIAAHEDNGMMSYINVTR